MVRELLRSAAPGALALGTDDEGLDGPALTVEEFCARNGQISRTTFYKLREAGKGPKLMRASPNRVCITRRAEAKWRLAREAEYEALATER